MPSEPLDPPEWLDMTLPWEGTFARYECPDPDCAWHVVRPWPELDREGLEIVAELHFMEHMRGEISFTCPRCGTTSHNPTDAREGYCARCVWWTGDPELGRQQPPG